MNVRSITLGVYGGLAGGVVCGVMMGISGTLPMIGKMVGLPSAAAGLVVHIINSAIIGAGFAVLFGRSVSGIGGGLGKGLLYGGWWWFLGPLTLMPLFMGMGVNWSGASAVTMLPSLVGHLVYGAILGTSYASLRERSGGYATAAVS